MGRRVWSGLTRVGGTCVFLLVHPVLTWSIDTPVLKEELVTGMRLMGVTSLSELKPEMVECLPP
jgi:hypothetical protein